jgi:type IV pilus assembly protein PilN
VQATTLEPKRDTKTGIITLNLRVVGPRDRAVDLVENLEHSKHFLMPRIVGESTESTGGPGERLEPVSASNRVSFELLAEYNPVVPTEHRAQNKQEGKKPSANGGRAGQSAPPQAAPPHRAIQPVHGQQPVKPPYTGPQWFTPKGNRNPVPNPQPNPNSGDPR